MNGPYKKGNWYVRAYTTLKCWISQALLMSLKVNCRKMVLTYKTRKKYPCRCNRLCRKKIDNNAACTVPNRRIKIKDCTQFYLSVNFWKSLGIGGVKGMNGRAKAQGTRHKAQERSKLKVPRSKAREKGRCSWHPVSGIQYRAASKINNKQVTIQIC